MHVFVSLHIQDCKIVRVKSATLFCQMSLIILILNQGSKLAKI